MSENIVPRIVITTLGDVFILSAHYYDEPFYDCPYSIWKSDSMIWRMVAKGTTSLSNERAHRFDGNGRRNDTPHINGQGKFVVKLAK